MPTAGRAVFQAAIRIPGQALRVVPLERFPCVLGRSREAGIRLEYPGVWERHFILDLDPVQGLLGTVGDGALAAVDGRPVTGGGRERLRNGSEVTLGTVVAQISLTPVRRRSLGGWETAAWVLMVVVALAQVGWAFQMLML